MDRYLLSPVWLFHPLLHAGYPGATVLSPQVGLREGPSARARGLRPAPPVGPLTAASRAALPRRRGRLPEEAMSEGARLTSNLASLTLRLSDPATARFSLLRPGQRVPTRETAPTPGD